MSDTIALFPFDPTGSLQTNKITNEQQVVTAVSYRDYHTLIPKCAPYFLESMKLTIKLLDGTVKELKKGIDWYGCFEFISASRACAAPIWGGIALLDTSLAGVVSLTYQTVGGPWAIDAAKISELLAYNLHNPRVTAWEQVVDLPMAFPVIDHEWDLVDLVGAKELVAALSGIEAAVRAAGGSDISKHLMDFANPHQTNKDQVLLGNVQNYPIATLAEARAGTSNTTYMTPALTSAMIGGTGGVGTALQDHIADHDNPHGTDAAHVGAYSYAEADVLFAKKLDKTGTAADSLKFNGRTDTAYKDFVLQGTAANSLEFDGLNSAEYAAQVLLGTAANSNLFAGQTYAQMMSDVLAGKCADTYKFGGMTPEDFATYIGSNVTATNTQKFNGMTAAEYAKWVLESGPAEDSAKLGGLTLDQVVSKAAAAASGGSFAESVVFGPEDSQDVGTYWTEIARLAVPAQDDPFFDSYVDTRWFMSGGESGGAVASPTYFVQASVRGPADKPVSLDAVNLSTVDLGAVFGYTVETLNGQLTARIWLRSQQNLEGMTLTLLSGTSDDFNPDNQVTAAPADIVYVTPDAVVRHSELETYKTAAATTYATQADLLSLAESITTAFTNLNSALGV